MSTLVASTDGRPAAVPDWSEVLADIGDRVRAERQARGWSLQHLGDRCGLTKQQVLRVEAGFIGMRNFATICWALDRPMADLLGDSWRLPERTVTLTVRQAEVLAAVAGGDSLAVVAGRLSMTAEGLSSVLTPIYRRLGVEHLPRGVERRMAAVRVAREHGLLNAA